MNEFLAIIKSNLKDYFPEEFGAEEVVIKKDIQVINGPCTSVGVKRKGYKYTPTVVIDDGYELFCKDEITMDEFLQELVSKIVKTYEELGEGRELFNLNKESIEKNIIYKMINATNNAELLKICPHRIISGDMALVYFIESMNTERVYAEACIVDVMAEALGFTEEQLFELASVNTPNKHPLEIGRQNFPFYITMAPWTSFSDEQLKKFLMGMTIFTTKEANSAAVIMYPGVLKRIYEAVGDFILLPSSINEVLVVPFLPEIDPSGLSDMVKMVNERELRPEEILSYTAYRCNGENLIPLESEREKKSAEGCC